MEFDHFDPPGNIDDFGADAALAGQWNDTMSSNFDSTINSIKAFLQSRGGGTCQFYNPVTHGLAGPDLPLSNGDITWNGFPKKFSSTGPGHPTRFADAEQLPQPGVARKQDEYLEWHVNRNEQGKILSVDFTCEAWDYFDFLGENSKNKVVELYRKFVSPEVQPKDLFSADGVYNRLNRFNTSEGAMHLTHSANNLFAEVFLAGSATVRRQQHGTELTASIPMIKCADYGDAGRNSDPNIGIAVNGLARDKRMITLANPVGLYMAAFDGAGLTLNGKPAGGFFTVVRGAFPLALRAVYQLPAEMTAQGLTVSDVKINARNLQFGGELAQRITMHLIGVGSVAQTVQNTPVGCGAIPQVAANENLETAAVSISMPGRNA